MNSEKYNPSEIEPKWQKIWEQTNIYKTPQPSENHPKKYILDMYPYPSGAVLHVGHMEGYVATDVVSRYYRMKGYSVLHPMGWDAFGLPAENYAVKTGIHPDKSTHQNIATFKNQLKMLGLSYDWEREIDTSSPDYYKWTQWLFTVLFKMGLAYKKKAAANFCPSCETVLANEQVEAGKCERCGTEVIQKELDQWFFRITAYADRLIEDLEKINWPGSTKLMQKNWIGRSEGVRIKFSIPNSQFSINEIEVFTTAPETIFGVSFLVLAPEHPLVSELLQNSDSSINDQLFQYVNQARQKGEDERVGENKEKTGFSAGFHVINPVDKRQIPVWVADYVMADIGTGAVMGVPAHDLRDFQFAKKYSLPIYKVIEPYELNRMPRSVLDIAAGAKTGITVEADCWEGDGRLVGSESFSGFDRQTAKKQIVQWLEKNNWGKRVTTYHLRDWLVSRQRYWGAPIPMIYCEKCNWQPVPLEELPVLLPTDVDFRPTGESPIARSQTFQQGAKCPQCGRPARREVDTMDTFVDSSWYFLRFLDPNNDLEFARKEEIEKWMSVDLYVGGGHTVQHLLFARFFEKALVDAGIVDKKFDEPFDRLRVPGWILGPDSRKMSKRWNNVVTPDEVVKQYGADTMRVYEMFMAPFEVDKPWNIKSVAGVFRFINRLFNLFETNRLSMPDQSQKELALSLDKLIDKVGNDLEDFRFNTAIAEMMKFINLWDDNQKEFSGGLSRSDLSKFLLILAPFAPHLAEELWHLLGNEGSIHQQSWPKVDKDSLKEERTTIVVQINGKKRDILGNILVDLAQDESKVLEIAKKSPNVARNLLGKEIKKSIFVSGRLLNLLVD